MPASLSDIWQAENPIPIVLNQLGDCVGEEPEDEPIAAWCQYWEVINE